MKLRKVLDNFASYEAGLSIKEIQEKYKLNKVIKLASNENPLGTSKKVLACLEEKISEAFRYPASMNPKLCQAIAKHYKLKPSQVVVGNGSDELIDLLFRITSEPNIHNALVFEPCFAMYVSQAKINLVELKKVQLKEDFSFNFEALIQEADANTRLVFITNPDNPSGYAVKKEEIIALRAKLPQEALLVIDEAYIDFCDEIDAYSMLTELNKYDNIVILRTFSKIYGLAGLRIGYALAPENIVEAIEKIRLPFSVNILADYAAQEALADLDYYNQSRAMAKKGREFLIAQLAQLGFKTYPSQANFIIVKPTVNALKLYNYLLENGIIIRKLTAYNLPDYLRISIGTDEENAELIAQIAKGIKNV